MAPYIAVVGSCMIDLSCFAPRLPVPGETLHGSSFSVGFGGKGANQAVAAAKLGGKVEMIARIGDDDYGQNYLQSFKDNGVGCEHVTFTPGFHSGVAQITVADNGENQIVIVPGANTHLCKQDVSKAQDILKGAAVAICQLETDPELVLHTASFVRSNGGLLILNAAPACNNIAPELLQNCDILCVNETEAGMIVNFKVSNVEDGRRAVTELLARGVEMVLLTLGSQGALFASQKQPEIIHVPSPKVNVVDTTGAGDAFIGALAFYLAYMPDLSMNDIVSRSCQIAAISVQQKGTQISYPTRSELPQELFKN